MKVWQKILLWLGVAALGFVLNVMEVPLIGFILSFVGTAAVLIIATRYLDSTNRK